MLVLSGCAFFFAGLGAILATIGGAALVGSVLYANPKISTLPEAIPDQAQAAEIAAYVIVALQSSYVDYYSFEEKDSIRCGGHSRGLPCYYRLERVLCSPIFPLMMDCFTFRLGYGRLYLFSAFE